MTMENKISTQKIIPNLWFEKGAEDAVRFYTRVFKDAGIGRMTHYTAEGYEFHQQQAGTVMTIDFSIEGQHFVALNGGPLFTFNEAISFVINCKDQEEIDYYWNRLTEGGDERAQVCGWLKDKFGVSWQVVPTQLNDMISDPDINKVNRVLRAMFQMKKLDVAALAAAYES